MLPIMISEGVSGTIILKVLGIKIVIGIISGFIIDFILRKLNKNNNKEDAIEHICEHDHCHCEEGIFKSAIKHTISIFVFILLISVILNIVISLIGEDTLAGIISNNPVFSALIAALVGLIPNCASSVILTELYLSGVLKLGVMIGGLLTNAGMGVLVLFRTNRDQKQNIKIVLTLYAIGAIAGMVLQLII